MASILVRFTQSPYQGSAMHDGLEFAMSATNYGHDVAVLFDNEAVRAFVAHQAPPAGVKTVAKRLNALALFEVEPCYVSASALAQRVIQLEDDDDIILIGDDQQRALLARFTHVVTF